MGVVHACLAHFIISHSLSFLKWMDINKSLKSLFNANELLKKSKFVPLVFIIIGLSVPDLFKKSIMKSFSMVAIKI